MTGICGPVAMRVPGGGSADGGWYIRGPCRWICGR